MIFESWNNFIKCRDGSQVSFGEVVAARDNRLLIPAIEQSAMQITKLEAQVAYLTEIGRAHV